MTKAQGHCRKIVLISPQLLCDLFRTSAHATYYRCTHGLPEDAQFIGQTYDISRDIHYLIFESEDWEPVPYGQELPIFKPVFKRYSVKPLLDQAAAFFEGKLLPDMERWLKDYRAIRDEL